MEDRVGRDKPDGSGTFLFPTGTATNWANDDCSIHYLTPVGMAGFILANSSLFSNRFGKDEIAKTIIEADRLDNLTMLPEA